MSDKNNTDTDRGRPGPTEKEKEDALRKLEPYLKSGLSVNKACLQAKLPKSTIYDWIERYDDFSERVEEYQTFLSVMVSNAVMRQFKFVTDKQLKGVELNKNEYNYIKWLATNSRATQEEFGNRVEHTLIDPEVQLKRLMGKIDEFAEE